MANNQNLKPFVKGDPRINRKGKPRNFDAFRELAQSIANEKITEVNGHGATVIEMILRKWASSSSPILQRGFVEIAYGKVPDKVELTGADNQPLIIKVVYDEEREE